MRFTVSSMKIADEDGKQGIKDMAQVAYLSSAENGIVEAKAKAVATMMMAPFSNSSQCDGKLAASKF